MNTIETFVTDSASAHQKRFGDRDRAYQELWALCSSVLGWSLAQLFTKMGEPLDPHTHNRLCALVERRLTGEPLSYLVGRAEFWSLELMVNPTVLVPRPETEWLVTHALDVLPPDATNTVMDLGTGSGAIAIALKTERAGIHMIAVDYSQAALQTAQTNANRAHCTMDFIQTSWLTALADRTAHIIVSNPPYIASDDSHLATDELRFEPRLALDGGMDGLQALRAIINEAPRVLHHGGYLFLEHGYDQRNAVRALLHKAGFSQCETWPDYAGHDRVSKGIWYG